MTATKYLFIHAEKITDLLFPKLWYNYNRYTTAKVRKCPQKFVSLIHVRIKVYLKI